MNKRTNKNIHKKFIADLGIEICQDLGWRKYIKSLALGAPVKIESNSIPKNFYKLNPMAGKYNLQFSLTRISPDSAPSIELNWWDINQESVCIAIRPLEFNTPTWYAVI